MRVTIPKYLKNLNYGQHHRHKTIIRFLLNSLRQAVGPSKDVQNITYMGNQELERAPDNVHQL